MAEELYRRDDSSFRDEAWEQRRKFLWGFGDAGKTINLVNSEDIQRTIDRAHERVYLSCIYSFYVSSKKSSSISFTS